MSLVCEIVDRKRSLVRNSCVIGISVCVAALCTLTMGCDDSFSPFTEDNADPAHALFGVLDSSADTQFVRVQVVRQQIDPISIELNELSFSSQEDNSALRTWSDSLVLLDDGSRAHLFFAVYSPASGRSVTLRASGPGNQETSVTVRMPIRPSVQAKPTEFFNGGIIKSILLTDISRKPADLAINYSVFDATANDFRLVSVPYNFMVGTRLNDGWEFTANLSGDRLFVASSLAQTRGTPVRLESVEIFMTDYGPEWDTRSPGENGFVGAIGRYAIPFELDSTSLDSLNYTL